MSEARLSRGLAPALLLGLLSLACGASGSANSANASQSCNSADSPRSVDIRHGGLGRSYTVHLHPKIDKAPLIIGLHGGWGDGEVFAKQSGLPERARAAGYSTVFPDGHLKAWNAGRCCALPARNNIDDVGFIKAVVADLVDRGCADPKRVYATGFSNGAMMAHRLACEAPALLGGIAPVAGGLMVDNCPATQAMPALLIQGMEDQRIPWEGGVYDEIYRPAMRTVASALAARNACSSAAPQDYSQGPAQCSRYACDQSAPVTSCGLSGVGHQWPGGRSYFPRLLGGNTRKWSATERILEFFDSLERAGQ